MEYLELIAPAVSDEMSEYLVVRLSEEGFDSFAEEGTEFRAYIPASLFRKERLEALFAETGLQYVIHSLPDVNWNLEWEKNFSPVMIAGSCFIRAPFHEPDPAAAIEVIIEPKMSFGTAHHETTSMMIEAMLETDFRDRSVLDMGCGTGVLAIVAEKCGAAKILAIDNDRWAFENTQENCDRNAMNRIQVVLGGMEAIRGKFTCILANINRNILLEQIPVYATVIDREGILMMSGFYTRDLDSIREMAEKSGLRYHDHRMKNDWVAVTFRK